MVVPDGHVVQKCCHCLAMRAVHAEHAHEARDGTYGTGPQGWKRIQEIIRQQGQGSPHPSIDAQHDHGRQGWPRSDRAMVN